MSHFHAVCMHDFINLLHKTNNVCVDLVLGSRNKDSLFILDKIQQIVFHRPVSNANFGQLLLVT